MEAVDHGWKKPGGGGPSKAVAHEFVEADKATHAYAGGGAVKEGSHNVEYAKGGGQLGRTKDFMKTPISSGTTGQAARRAAMAATKTSPSPGKIPVTGKSRRRRPKANLSRPPSRRGNPWLKTRLALTRRALSPGLLTPTKNVGGLLFLRWRTPRSTV